MTIGIRPSTIRRLRRRRLVRVSPLHISIARLSYLKDQQQQEPKAVKEEGVFYTIIKRGKKVT